MSEPVQAASGAPVVLVVDDELPLLRAVARTLRAAGCTVTECELGSSAAALLSTQTFDVVLSDIDMPGLSGIELLKLLRQRNVEVPVVLMTGAPTLETAMKAVEHGAFKYLTKPVDLDELVDTVSRAAKSARRSADSSQRLQSGTRASTTRARIEAGVVLAERYRLVRLLGEGGMGQVWEAVQLPAERAVAIKLLHSSLNESVRTEMRRRMLREARAASAVEHPNVVDVYDMFELEDGTPVMVMALLRGRTLGRLLAETPRLSLQDAANLLLPVVSAVGTAHASGVIHRDLKPDNIFLAEDGGRTTVMVLDFGIAKLVSIESQEGAVLTAAGTPMGTPGYMAPEQAMGERDVDHRVDVWSLGAILYEMLSGWRPVQADSMAQAIKKLFMDTIVPLAERSPEVSPAVAELVDSMLARDRDQRPDDLREVYAELARHAGSGAPGFGPPMLRGAVPPPVVSPPSDAMAFAPTEAGTGPLGPGRTE